MTRYLLDTNIVSEATKPAPSPAIIAWLGEREAGELFIASLTFAEIRRGILAMPQGRKRATLQNWFAGPEGPPAYFAGRILAFDDRAAMEWAALMTEAATGGRPRDAFDTIIAAVARVNDCMIVTANLRDFAGLGALNPLSGH